MMKFTLGLAVYGFLACVVMAQDVTGVWQGMLPAKPELRIVVKIATAGKSGLSAVIYSIDEAGQGSAGSVTLKSSTVRIAVPAMQGEYVGMLDEEAHSLTGTWVQRGESTPLNLKRIKDEDAWPIPPPPARARAMPADADPIFEVATIKPSDPAAQGKSIKVNGRQISMSNYSVTDMLMYSYGLHPRQIAGGPGWMESEKYDVTGKPEGEGQPNARQWKIMLQKLLVDRFQLTVHRERKELSVYAITVGKGGPKLVRSTDTNGPPSLVFGRPLAGVY